MTGIDSAFGPTPEQAATAKGLRLVWPDGSPRDAPSWWLFYCGQRSEPNVGRFGAFNVWSLDDVKVIRDAGFLPVPCFVPLCVAGRIVGGADPERDAQLVAWTLATFYRVEGVIELDTEASMRGDPFTVEYEQRFTAEVRGPIGWAANTYAGAFSFADPPTGFPHWIWPGRANPGEARQSGQVDLGGGLIADLDSAGHGFNFGRYTSG